MRKSQQLILILIIMTFKSSTLNASPVANLDIAITQPNSVSAAGKTFSLKPQGDEWANWYETYDGYTVIKDELTHVWHYGSLDTSNKLRPSGKVLGRDNPELSGIKHHVRPDPIFHPSSKKLFPTFKRQAPAQAPVISPSVVSISPTPQLVQQAITANVLQAPLTVPILFILVQFTNRSGTYAAADFANLISNQLGPYFAEVSYGRFNIAPASENHGLMNDGVVGWLTLNQLHPNTAGASGATNQQLAANAINAADPYVDYAAYDLNGDGFIDSTELAIVIIPAGYETAFGGTACTPSPSVWGHQWSINSPLIPPTVDGKIVGSSHNGNGGYAQFGEIHGATAACNPSNLSGYKDHEATIGIMAHELGHLILHLPDLYDTTGLSQGIGTFSLMSAGNWGFKKGIDTYQGQTPVHPDAWCKLYKGWVDPVVNSLGPITLPAAGGSGASAANAVQVQLTSDPNQYFLFENRAQYGFDAGLSGLVPALATAPGTPGGIAIWHIDESMRTAITLMAPNNVVAHKFIDLLEADGISTMDANLNRGESNDLFFFGNKAIFDDLSTPNSRLQNGSSTGISFSSISVQGQDMSASFALQKVAQTLTFSSAPLSLNVNGTGTLVATSTSGLAVSFSSLSPATCSVATNIVTALAIGTCNIAANQTGNAIFSAAVQVLNVINITALKNGQTITFTNPPTSLAINGSSTLIATASSGLAVTFSSSNSKICSVVGNIVTALTSGTCNVAANQAGNATFLAAVQVVKVINIAVILKAQTITFSSAPASLTVKSTGSLVATASSGLAVTFTSSTPTVCSVASSKVTALKIGTCSLNANQAGNASFLPAVQVVKSFLVK